MKSLRPRFQKGGETYKPSFADVIKFQALYKDNPVRLMEDLFFTFFVRSGVPPDRVHLAIAGWQKEVLMALAERNYVAVTGANEVGKTFVAVAAIIWFELTRTFPRIQCTSVDSKQLSTVLWAELGEWYGRSADLQRAYTFTDTMLYRKGHKKTWFAVARTARKQKDVAAGEHSTGLQGIHARHVLFVIDEASGVADANWESAESSIREEDNRLLAISNPLRTEGKMFEIFNVAGTKQYWFTKQVSYLDSNRLTPQKRAIIEDQIKMYGADSPIVQIRHFGKFPVAGSPDAVPSYLQVRKAVERAKEFDMNAIELVLKAFDKHGPECMLNMPYTAEELNGFHTELSKERLPGLDLERFYSAEYTVDDSVYESWESIKAQYFKGPCRLGVDLARFGSSEIVFCVRRGSRVVELVGRHNLKADAIITRIKEYFVKYKDLEAAIVDKTGLAGEMAIEDPMVAEGYPVVAVGFGEHGTDPARYANLATEMWMYVADNIDDMMIPNDPLLVTQLTTRKYGFTGKKKKDKIGGWIEQVVVESKDKMKARKLQSPDRADGVCLAFAKVKIISGDYEEDYSDIQEPSVEGEFSIG